ncbi:aldo/keto reductase [Egibacter rhizosphaerae]|uniref:Aldo/keto reductase n=1 Tax=Egibacter rhizosphaerae TaxID=1670831 RepID=A0A411YAT8_9ACTN|nr:aldo/keto reductase [Egibacter rhizosphaerae]QBI18306.1 aldo/keto reductase [Egibacter rhizosphaerae]
MSHVTVRGEDVPALGLGTFQQSGDECYRAVGHALAVGYRHVDTAQMYRNEAEVGRAMAEASVPRDAVFVTTKLAPRNLTPDAVRSSHEQSLRDLRVDGVDLLLIHWPNPDVPLEDTLEAMETLRAEGKARHLGVSNFPPSWLDRAAKQTELLSNQVEYHPYLNQRDLLERCAQHDLALTAYSPLARGAISRDPEIRAIADAHGRTPAQVVLRWLLQQDRVVVIPKATAPARVEENFDVFDFELAGDEMAAIHALDRGNAGREIDPPSAPDWERTD